MVVGEKSKRKKPAAAELPEEVVLREILTRLPIKSVGRFKCVSKSWLSLISDPQFVKQHLNLSTTQNPDDYDCLIVQKNDKIVILSRYKETSALLSVSRFGLIGSVRGLVCLSYGNNFSLWNPAIHQSKEFSIPPRRPRHSWYPIGFGFDPISDNYKVVVLSPDLKFDLILWW
ncbi:putative F-box protein At1g47790 [Apium graveolens]|uniref:putative F-box protein At1g47790 n=1 Tax=Apium graveolens TaxID=4045 RepID=UPI003D7AB5E7